MIPFSILFVLVIAIGFIKPDITRLGEQQLAYAMALSQNEARETLYANIEKLRIELGAKKNDVDFVDNYFPETLDQERVIDAYNFLASQSGVAVALMSVKSLSPEERTERLGLRGIESEPVADTTLNGGVAVPSVPSYQIRPETFVVTVSVRGTYETIRAFLDRVAHTDRTHRTRNFSLFTPVQDVANEEDEAAGVSVLTGTFDAEFDYAPIEKNINATSAPIFTKGSFDLSSIEKVRAWVTSPAPLLVRPSAGRPNPFQ